MRFIHLRSLACLIAFLLSTLVPMLAAANEPLRLGVYAYRPHAILEARFQPLADYLSAALDDRRVDVGFVRTGLIEHMAHVGKLDPSYLKVINPQQLAGFPYRVSTRLYPEWPLLALPTVDRTNLLKISSALLTLEASHPAAQAAGIGGFTPPADYAPVEELARQLRMPPYDLPPEVKLLDIWEQYEWFVVGGTLALLTIAFLTTALWRRNQALQEALAAEKKAKATLLQFSQAIEQSQESVVITNLVPEIE